MNFANAKRIGVVSDMHCGSIYGLMPCGFVRSDGAVAPLNGGQEYLAEKWGETIAWFAKRQPHIMVVLGDVIDGPSNPSRGRAELALPVTADQIRAAEACLLPLKGALPAAVWYFLKGTEWHDSEAGQAVETLAGKMGATPYDGIGLGYYCKEAVDLEIGNTGIVCNFAHPISVSGGLYRATPHDREGVWSALAGKEHLVPRADAVVRAHAHYLTEVAHPSKCIYTNPAWQLQTGYMRKKSLYRMLPDIGVTLLYVDGEAKRAGERAVVMDWKTFALPPRVAVRVEV